MEHGVFRNAVVGLRLAVPVILGFALASCGVSQLTEPLQRGLLGGGESQNANAESAQPSTATAGLADGSQNSPGGFSTQVARAPLGCPVIEIQPDSRTITFTAPDSGNDPKAVLHRGEIVEVARECGTSATGITVKYGLSGRVLLGPRGKPGSITLPAELKIVDRNSAVIKKQSIRVVANVSAGETAGVFSLVKNVDLRIPAGVTAKNYKIYVGFDRVAGKG